MAAIEDGPTVHFGSVPYESFIDHKDETRKASYLARHKAREDWTLCGVLGTMDSVEQALACSEHSGLKSPLHFSVCPVLR